MQHAPFPKAMPTEVASPLAPLESAVVDAAGTAMPMILDSNGDPKISNEAEPEAEEGRTSVDDGEPVGESPAPAAVEEESA